MRDYRWALVVLAALAGCAGEPRPATPAAAPVSASGTELRAASASATAGGAAAASTAPAASAAPAATDAAVGTKTATADTKFKPPSGWSTRVKNGETVYCRSDTAIGSRIPVKYCLSQADLQEFLRHQQHAKEDLERTRLGIPTICPAGQVCN